MSGEPLGRKLGTAGTPGAIVEIDMHKLSRAELVMFGQKTMVDKYRPLIEARMIGMGAAGEAVLGPILAMMLSDEDEITIELVRSAEKNKAATVTDVRGKQH